MGTLVTADGGFDLQKKAGGGRKPGKCGRASARSGMPQPRDSPTFPADPLRPSQGFGSSGRLMHCINAMLISRRAAH